jgi:hypothetical protein
MRKLLLLTTLMGILFANISQAQKDTVKLDGMIYSFVPQYLINKGIRIDIEKQITPRSFIQFCPQFYLGEQKDFNSTDIYYDDVNYDDDDFNKVTGGGLNIYHKIFANTDFTRNGVYFSYGFSFSYFEIDYYEEYLGSTINANGKIQKYGGDLLIGYQFFFGSKLSLDLYTGAGTRFSTMDTNGENHDRFNSNYFGYNYQGNLLHVGLRIGLIL